MNESVRKALQAGRSIVAELVEIGIHAHRPFEAMTDEVLSVNAKFSNKVADRNQLTEYLQQELALAKRTYVEQIKGFIQE